ncbi:hypothetical protein ACFX1X_045833 [Malus domestica]
MALQETKFLSLPMFSKMEFAFFQSPDFEYKLIKEFRSTGSGSSCEQASRSWTSFHRSKFRDRMQDLRRRE